MDQLRTKIPPKYAARHCSLVRRGNTSLTDEIAEWMGRPTTEGDGPTIGLILCAEKNEAVARYSVLHASKQLFAAKYVTYLPTVEELQREIERERKLIEAGIAPPPGDPRVVRPDTRRGKR